MRRTPRPRFLRASSLLLAAVLAAGSPLAAQVATPGAAKGGRELAPRVFLESPGVDLSAFPAEVGYVNPVPVEAEAQVVVRIASRREAGRDVYDIAFAGRHEFAGRDDKLTYAPPEGETPDETRKALLGRVKLGLLRYASKTPVAARMGVRLLDVVKPTSVVDPWRFWVFSLSANAFIMGESTYRSSSLFGNLSANRVTPEWKIRLSLQGSSSRDVFDLPDYHYDSASTSQGANGLVVKSLGEHWSVGGFLTAYSSTYENILSRWTPQLAVEWDLFRYSDSTKKQLRFLYRIGPARVRYREETIYDKTRETLWQESLTSALELKQPWGSISTSLTGSHYFHDLKAYRLELNAEISWRIVSGLSFEIGGGGSRIHDQLFLPKGGATLEEVLLRRRQLETTYSYFFMVGLSYTFGSTRSTVVNPRFGSGSGGFSMSISY